MSGGVRFPPATTSLRAEALTAGILLFSRDPRSALPRRPFCLVRHDVTGAEGYLDGTGPVISAFDAVADQPPDRAIRCDRRCKSARRRRIGFNQLTLPVRTSARSAPRADRDYPR